MTSTVHLTTKEDRRTWQALTRIAPTVEDDPLRSYVCLDGERAYATDGYMVGALPAVADLPILEVDEEEIRAGSGELVDVRVEYGQPERVILPARLLRDAIGLAAGKTHVRLRLEADHLLVILGDDPLPGLGEAPTVTVPYADAPNYPPVETLRRHLLGDPLEIFVEGDDDRTVELAGEAVTRVGLSAKRLARLGDLEYRHDGDEGGHVTIRPRPSGRLLEIRAAATDVLLGVLSPLHLGDARPAHTASGEESRRSVTITQATAEALGEIVDDARDRLEEGDDA